MTIETKIRKIGNSYGIILPKEVLQEMKVSEGATLYMTESSENSVRITRENPDFKTKSAIVYCCLLSLVQNSFFITKIRQFLL